MQVSINVTSEQIIKTALSRYKTQHESPDMLLANVVAEMRSNADPATVIRQAVTNSIAKGIKEAERDVIAKEQEFESIGQMSLLGDLIPEHKIPAAMRTKSVAEVYAWIQQRAEIEQQNLEEMRAAFRRQESKTKKFLEWLNAVRKVKEALEHSGFDPNEVNYNDAISKAQTIQPGSECVSGAQAKRDVR